ncbi:MAG: 4Fe-4S binding protein [Clostridia bacterium]|nr:4Fe-4S binding protein [Clostridia bacterium]
MAVSKEDITRKMQELFRTTPGNVVTAEEALPGCEGLVMYDAPLIGFASADDPLFETYKDPTVNGDAFLTPKEWMGETRTVVSFFLPFTEDVRKANRQKRNGTAPEWLHARIEGQRFLMAYCYAVQEWLEEQGVKVCIPSGDERFRRAFKPFTEGEPSRLGLHVTSAWSERHAAYAAGLGTFSLTRAIITEKGTAGRFGSLLLSAEVPADERPYTGIDDYCIRCGVCVERCPFHAISLERGKDQMLCMARVVPSRFVYKPRYGCGKCQVGVPCEARNPSKIEKP